MQEDRMRMAKMLAGVLEFQQAVRACTMCRSEPFFFLAPDFFPIFLGIYFVVATYPFAS